MDFLLVKNDSSLEAKMKLLMETAEMLLFFLNSVQQRDTGLLYTFLFKKYFPLFYSILIF